MKKLNRPLVAGLGALAFGVHALFSYTSMQPQWSKNFSPLKDGNKDVLAAGLNAEQLIASLAGFRELVSGILWVRADSFFDTGNFDAILPLIKIVTTLDPKAIDVYATGIWHIGYNFTDEEQRSDRRYIPSALALGESGSRNNDKTYELFFETSWLWYHKIDDNYQKSVDWMEKAHEKFDILPARRRLLSRLYERNGQPEKSIDNWFTLLTDANRDLAEFNKKNAKVQGSEFSTARDVIERNLDTLLQRMSQRGYFAQMEKRDTSAYDINPKFDVGFSARVSFVDERVMVVDGTWNVLPVGTRIRCVLRDKDYPNTEFALPVWDSDKEVRLDPPKERTWMQELCFVRNQRFDKKIDMSRDPTMYPFVGKEYVLELFYNPRGGAVHIQDQFGFNGEGMTDKNFLNTEARPGARVIYAKFDVTRDMIFQRGEWSGKTPVIQTPNYVASDKSYNDDAKPTDIPSLRAQKDASGANPAPKSK